MPSMKTRAMARAVATGLIALSLGACAEQPGSSPTDEITVWTWTGAPGAETMEAIAAGFEAKTGIAVNSVVVERADYLQQLQLALNAGEPLDVIGVQPNDAAREAQPHLRPLSEWEEYVSIDESDFTTLSIEQSHRLFTDDELYSLPFGTTGSAVCFYNADILGELGLQPPTTWDEMKTLSHALADAKPGVLPMVMPGEGWFHEEFVLTMVGQSDPNYFNDFRYEGKPYNTDSLVEGLTRYVQLYEDGTLSRDGLDLAYADAMAAFYEGKAAIACNGTWEAGVLLKEFRAANGMDISSVGAMAVPADDPSTLSLRSFLDITLGITKYSEHTEAAAQFIEFATTGEGADILGSYLGFVPAGNGWTLDESVLGDDQVAVQGYALIQDLVSNPHSDRNNLVAFSLRAGEIMKESIHGRLTPREASDRAQAEWDSGKFA